MGFEPTTPRCERKDKAPACKKSLTVSNTFETLTHKKQHESALSCEHSQLTQRGLGG